MPVAPNRTDKLLDELEINMSATRERLDNRSSWQVVEEIPVAFVRVLGEDRFIPGKKIWLYIPKIDQDTGAYQDFEGALSYDCIEMFSGEIEYRESGEVWFIGFVPPEGRVAEFPYGRDLPRVMERWRLATQ